MTAGHVGNLTAMRAVAPAGIRSAKSIRDISIDLYCADEVAAGWHSDSRMRAKMRRLVNHVRAASGAGARSAASGTP